MNSTNLDNLVSTGQLKSEPFDQNEFDGLVKSGKTRLKDADNNKLNPESRFILAYGAAHSFALAALRWHGFRSNNRYIVFPCLEHTISINSGEWRILAKCHDKRNVAEYEGQLDIDDQLLLDLLRITKILSEKIENLNK